MRYLVQVIMRREIRSSPRMITDAAIAAALLPWGIAPTLAAVVLAAVGKELWDAQGHGTPDRIDALVTVAGGAAMLGWLLYAAPAIAQIT